MKKVLGIDVGATGIKAALVDVNAGKLITDRIKYPTPKPATPQAIVEVMKQLIKDFKWEGKQVGVGFPAIIKEGVTLSASNISESWLEFPITGFLKKKLKCPVQVINDADAAGIAERAFGEGDDEDGVVILLTLGTGVGSAVFLNGKLLPNTELGQLKHKGGVIEDYAANSARETKDLSYQEWGKELNKALNYIEFIFSPDLFIIGGGISKKFYKYKEFLKTNAPVTPAKMLNNAGIVGAAMCIDYIKED